MLDYLRKLAAPVFFLKATTKKQVWIPQFTKKNGQVVGGHFAMVHVSDDHDHHKVASGAGTYSQKKAHGQLKDEPGFSLLTAEHQAALVMHHATQIQDAESMAARLATLKKKLLAGQKPTAGEWKYFHAAPAEKQQAITEAVHSAGHGALMDAEYAAYVGAQPPANEAPAEAAPPAPEAKKEPQSAPEAEEGPANEHEAKLQAALNEYQKAYAKNPMGFQMVHGKIKTELYFVAGKSKNYSLWAAEYYAGKGGMEPNSKQLEMFATDVIPVLKKHGWPEPHSNAMAAAMKEVSDTFMVPDDKFLNDEQKAAKAAKQAEQAKTAGSSLEEAKAAYNAKMEAKQLPTVSTADGEFWLLSTGATNGKGEVFAHLASKTSGSLQGNGWNPKQINTYISPSLIKDPKAEAAAAAQQATGLAMPEYVEGKTTTGVKKYYEGVSSKIMAMAAAGDVAGLEAMPQPEKGSWGGKTFNSKKLLELHAAALAQAKGGAKPAPEAKGDRASKFAEAKKDPHKDLAAEVSAAGWPVMVGSKGVLLASSPDYPKTYANQTQAANAAQKVAEDGFDAEVIGFHPYYVKINGKLPGGAKADTGPKEGDTKQGKGGVLVLKDGHWILSATDNGAWTYLKDAAADDSTKTVMEAAKEWLAANPGKEAELSSSLVDMGFLSYAKDLGIYVPPGAQAAPSEPEPAADPAHDAKVAAANAEPVDAQALQQLVNAFHDAKVPLSNTNAKAYNPKVDAIIAALQAGDKATLLGMSFGTNTYGKKAAKLANEALQFLGSRHAVTPGQKAGAHPKYKVTAIKQNAPAAPAAAAAPAPAEPEQVGSGPVPPAMEGLTITAKDSLKTAIEAFNAGDMDKLQLQNALTEGLHSYASVNKYIKAAIAHLNELKEADNQEALINGWKAAIGSGKVPTKAQAEAMDALEQANPDQHLDEMAEAHADLGQHMGLPFESDESASKAEAEMLKLHAQAKGEAPAPAPAVGLTDADIAKVNAGGVNEEMVVKVIQLAKEGDLAGLEAYVTELAATDWPTTAAYGAALATLLEKKQGKAPDGPVDPEVVKAAFGGKNVNALQHLMLQAVKNGQKQMGEDIAKMIQQLHGEVEQGPKDGDTKQGANGMLVFQNGRWHKMGDDPKVLKQKAASVPMPKLKGTNSIKLGKVMKQIKAAAEAEGAAGVAKLVQLTASGHVKMKGFKTINPDGSQYGANAEAAAKYAKAMVAAMAGTKGSGAPVDAPAAPAAAPQAATKPAPAGIKTLMVSRILNGGIKNADHWTKTGAQKGSNSGGFYTDSDGQQWYVKTPESPDHVKNELLANKLYAALGIKVPEVQQVKLGGKLSIASKVVDGLKKDPAALKTSDDMLMGFGADAWLANWDAVGLSHDNAMVDKDGSVYRIDPGGALLYRAQGTAKGAAFGDTVTELDTLRDASKNPQAASVFGAMTPEQIEESVKQVLLLKDSAIQKLCMAYGPGDKAAREALAAKLIARKADLAAKFPNAAKAAGPQKSVHIAPAPNFKEWNGPGQGLSSKAHINEQNQRLANEMQKLAADGKLPELEAMQFQPINKDTGLPEGSLQPIAQHKSKHIPLYWKDLISALKNPVRSMEHMKDAVVETVGGVFGTLVSAFEEVKGLKDAAAKIGRYALIGKVDGDPFESWKIKELSQANGAINAKDLYDQSHAAYNKLSNIEKEAIKQYTGSGYSTMNNAATGVGSHSNTDYAIAGFDKASVPLKPGTVLSRKFSFQNQADLQKFLEAEGGIVKDFGMISTSLRPSVWSGNIHLRIVCGEGVKGCYVAPDPVSGGKAISMHPGEQEVVLPYGTKFFVRKVSKQGHMVKDEHGQWGTGGYVIEVVALPNT